MAPLIPLPSVRVSGALRSCGTSHVPESLSRGLVSSDPISHMPPYFIPLHIPRTILLAEVRMHLHAGSLPVSVAIVSSIGVRGPVVPLRASEAHAIITPASSTVSGDIRLQVVSIDMPKSAWRYSDRIRFSAHFYGYVDGEEEPRTVREVVDAHYDPIMASILSDTEVHVAAMPIDGSPLTISSYQIQHPMPPHAFGAVLEDGSSPPPYVPFLADRRVDVTPPQVDEFAREARRIEREAVLEQTLRALGELASAIEIALEGSGQAPNDVHQATFVHAHDGYLRALASTSATYMRQPSVDCSLLAQVANYDIFPLMSSVRYMNAPLEKSEHLSSFPVDLLPSLDHFDIESVRALRTQAQTANAGLAGPLTGARVSLLTDELFISDHIVIDTDRPIRISTPVGAKESDTVLVELAAGIHTVQFADVQALVPLEFEHGFSAHTDVRAAKGRKGFIHVPHVGIVHGDTTHDVHVHIFHTDLIPNGTLILHWSHDKETISTISFPLDHANTAIVAADSPVHARNPRRKGIPIRQENAKARDIRASSNSGKQACTWAFWMFVDGDDRIDTWRTAFNGGDILRVEHHWHVSTHPIISDSTSAELCVHVLSAETITTKIPREAWTYVCYRAHAHQVHVVFENEYSVFPVVLHTSSSLPSDARIDIPNTLHVHITSAMAWDQDLDDDIIRVLSTCDSISPRMMYDRTCTRLHWRAQQPSAVGMETSVVVQGPLAPYFTLSNRGRVWYFPKPFPAHLVSLTFDPTAMTTRAQFSCHGSLTTAYATGEGLTVLAIEGNTALLAGNVALVPSGSFIDSNGVLIR